MTANILIGTCNWADHEAFYPPELERGGRQKEQLAWYAKLFPIVEVDSSFYGIPKPATTARWAAETPDSFRFNIKAYRTFTGHGLREDRHADLTESETREFEEALKPLRDAGKLRAIHYQFPPWFTFDRVQNRQALVDATERHPHDMVAFEFRHVSWFLPQNLRAAEELVREAGAAWVSVDAPQGGKGTAPRMPIVTSDRLALVRFHGRNQETWYRRTASSRERFDYYYTRAELGEWREAVREMAAAVQEVHLLMNTNNRNQGPVNAYRAAAVFGVPLPPPPASIAAEVAAG